MARGGLDVAALNAMQADVMARVARGDTASRRSPMRADNRARQELLTELATVEAALRRARPPALVLHREKLIDALLGGFINATVDVRRQLEDAE